MKGRPGARGGRVVNQAEDGRFKADGCRAGIQQDIDKAGEIIQDMLGASGAGAGELVRARRRDGQGRRPQERQRGRMIGHAQGDRVEAGRQISRNAFRFLQHQRQGARPKLTPEFVRPSPARRARPAAIGRMRRYARSAGRCRGGLGGENLCDRRRVQSIGAQSIDRLGGKGHHPPGQNRSAAMLIAASSGELGSRR